MAVWQVESKLLPQLNHLSRTWGWRWRCWVLSISLTLSLSRLSLCSICGVICWLPATSRCTCAAWLATYTLNLAWNLQQEAVASCWLQFRVQCACHKISGSLFFFYFGLLWRATTIDKQNHQNNNSNNSKAIVIVVGKLRCRPVADTIHEDRVGSYPLITPTPTPPPAIWPRSFARAADFA